MEHANVRQPQIIIFGQVDHALQDVQVAIIEIPPLFHVFLLRAFLPVLLQKGSDIWQVEAPMEIALKSVQPIITLP